MHELQEESLQCHGEYQAYCEVYELYQHAQSAPPSPPVRPPGLPVPPVESTAKPRRSAVKDEDDHQAREEEVALKSKEGDKLHSPSYPTITNLVSWQTALTQQLVQTS